MSTKALFVSAAYVKQFSPIQNNVGDDIINVSIAKAQTKYILPAMGKVLYDYMIDNIAQNDGPSTLPVDYIELLEDYITPALTAWALYESIIGISFKFQNKGVGRQNDQFQQSSTLDELIYLRGEYRNDAEWAQKRLQKYLSANSDKFPEYSVQSFDLNPSKDAGKFSSGMVFNKRKNKLIEMYSESNPWSGRIINS